MDNKSTVNRDFSLIHLRTLYDSYIRFTHPEMLAFNKTPSYSEAQNRKARLAAYESFSCMQSFIELKNVEDSSRLSLQSDRVSSISIYTRITDELLFKRYRPFYGETYILDLTGKAMENVLMRRIRDDDLASLTDFLERHSEISGLNLCYNKISNHGFQILSKYLAVNSNIKHLNLLNNEITSLNRKKLMKIVPRWNLTCLRLTGNKIGPEGGKTIAAILKVNKSLKHLDIGETDQTLASVVRIVDILIIQNGNRTITKLNLSRVLLTTDIHEFCKSLARVTELNRTVTELILSKNELTDSDLEILLKGVDKNCGLRRLNLSCNKITSIGVLLIAELLPASPLKALILSHNHIGDEGAMGLGKAFSSSKLTYLDISCNEVGDKGITFLIWGINVPMNGLFISGNNFTGFSLKVIYSQINHLLLSVKKLDITIWLDEAGEIHSVPKYINRYNQYYYCVYQPSNMGKVHHCCCPIRNDIYN